MPRLTAEEYFQRAATLLEKGYARLGKDGRLYHPGVRTHAVACRVQAAACVELAQPECDQVRAPK